MFAGERGWAGVTVEDLEIDLSGTPDEVWMRLVGVSYELAVLDEAALEGLRVAFVEGCSRWRRADGLVGCTMACSLVEAVRCGI